MYGNLKRLAKGGQKLEVVGWDFGCSDSESSGILFGKIEIQSEDSGSDIEIFEKLNCASGI